MKQNRTNVTVYGKSGLISTQTILLDTTSNTSTNYKITYNWTNPNNEWFDSSSRHNDQLDGYTYTTYFVDEDLYPLTVSNIENTKLVSRTEEKIEDYIQDNYDRYIIREYGSYIYEKIQEQAYEITCKVVEDAKEYYDIQDEDAIVEAIMELIDFDMLYELVEDILYAPVSMEEKLADVGMSIKDFL